MKSLIGTLMLVELDSNIQLKYKHLFFEKDNDKRPKSYTPLVVCDDEIKVGDWFVEFLNNKPLNIRHLDVTPVKGTIHATDKKILVLPNQFSQEFLQAIVDGKVKDGDKVEVEMECKEVKQCECKSNEHCLNSGIKLHKDGTVIVRKYKETAEEAALKILSRNGKIKREGLEMIPAVTWDAFLRGFKAGADWKETQ